MRAQHMVITSMAKQFDFQPEKSLAATAYLAQRTGETMYTILKMVYVTDRLHLERYGRPVTGDDFFAMQEGACPSKIYDSMKVLRGENNTNYLPDSEKYLAVDPTTNDVEVKDMPSMNVLSASEIECLDETISVLNRLGRWHIRKLAHDAAWEQTARNCSMDFVAIAKSIKDGGDILAKHLEKRFSS